MILTREKLTITDLACARATRIRLGMKLRSPDSTSCEVHLNNPSRLCGKELLEYAKNAHGCADAAWDHGHSPVGDWWAGLRKSRGDRVETEQFISEYEPEARMSADAVAIPDAGGGRRSQLERTCEKEVNQGSVRTQTERSNKPRTATLGQSGSPNGPNRLRCVRGGGGCW